MKTSHEEITSADVHYALAKAIHTALGCMKELAMLRVMDEMQGKDSTLEVSVSEFGNLISNIITLASFCLRHDLIDLGALESVWAEHLPDEETRSLSKRISAMAKMSASLEIPQ